MSELLKKAIKLYLVPTFNFYKQMKPETAVVLDQLMEQCLKTASEIEIKYQSLLRNPLYNKIKETGSNDDHDYSLLVYQITEDLPKFAYTRKPANTIQDSDSLWANLVSTRIYENLLDIDYKPEFHEFESRKDLDKLFTDAYNKAFNTSYKLFESIDTDTVIVSLHRNVVRHLLKIELCLYAIKHEGSAQKQLKLVDFLEKLIDGELCKAKKKYMNYYKD